MTRRAARTDKADEFAELWRRYGTGPLCREYRFSRDLRNTKGHRRMHKFDFACPEKLLAVEIDGNAWTVAGGGRHGKDADNEKMNLAAVLGWRVMHFSPAQLRDNPLQCIEMVKAALGLSPAPGQGAKG